LLLSPINRKSSSDSTAGWLKKASDGFNKALTVCKKTAGLAGRKGAAADTWVPVEQLLKSSCTGTNRTANNATVDEIVQLLGVLQKKSALRGALLLQSKVDFRNGGRVGKEIKICAGSGINSESLKLLTKAHSVQTQSADSTALEQQEEHTGLAPSDGPEVHSIQSVGVELLVEVDRPQRGEHSAAAPAPSAVGEASEGAVTGVAHPLAAPGARQAAVEEAAAPEAEGALEAIAEPVIAPDLYPAPVDVLEVDDFVERCTPDQREVLLQRLLKQKHKEKERHVRVSSKNNTHADWYRFTSCTGTHISYDNFRRNVPENALTDLATSLGGTQSSGVQHLTRRLFDLDAQAVFQGVRAAGAVAVPPMSAVETVGLQTAAKLSDSQRLNVARVLKHHNNGIAVLATQRQVARVEHVQAAEKKCGAYIYIEKGKAGEGEVERTVKYEITCPLDAVMSLLASLRDSADSGDISIGRNFGARLGEALGYNLFGDHGGTAMQYLLSLLADADGPPRHFRLGCADGKDLYHIMKHTGCTTINHGVGMLNDHNALIIEWEDAQRKHFDFVLIPATAAPVAPANGDRRALPAGISLLRDDDGQFYASWGMNEVRYFDREDIPQQYTVKYLPLVPFLCGDLLFQGTVQGRGNHASCKCLTCNMKIRDKDGNDWQAQRAAGQPMTSQQQEDQVTLYRRTHPGEVDALEGPPLAANPVPFTQAQKGKAEKVAGYTGLTTRYNLLSNIPAGNYVVPCLHIILGLVQDLVRKLYTFAEQYIQEPNVPMANAQQRLKDAEAHLAQAQVALSDLPALAEVPANVREAWRHERATAETVVKDAKLAMGRCKTDLDNASKDKRYWAVVNALDDLLKEYNISRNTYHNNSLVGEHCRRLLEVWPALAPRVSAVFAENCRRLSPCRTLI
jgi:hypothetical protein